MKRIFVAPVETVPNNRGGFTNRLKLGNDPANLTAIIPTDPDTGLPRFTWGIGILAAPDVTAWVANPALGAFPDASLDIKWAAIDKQIQRKVGQFAANFGVDLTTVDSVRDVVNAFGRALDPAFTADAFDVYDVPPAAPTA